MGATSRRTFLSTAPVAALLAGHVAPAIIDPVFAAIDLHKSAHESFARVCTATDSVRAGADGRAVTEADHNAWDAACDAENAALAELIETVPQTKAGFRALIEHVSNRDILGYLIDYDHESSALFFATLLKSPLLAA